jgi:aspartate aminotransferase
MKLSATMSKIEESSTLKFAGRAKEMQANGINVIALSAGELDCPSPVAAKKAGISAIDSNFTRYTVNCGLMELRQLIAQKLKEENYLDYAPDQILVSHGAKQSMFNILFSLCTEGDEVVIFSPYWTTYPQQVKMCGATPVIVPTYPANDYQIDESALRSCMTSRTRVMIVNSPNNPTGAVYSPESFTAIAKLAIEYDCWLLSDEIYEKIVFNPTAHLSPLNIEPRLKERTILVNGFSKSYAMTGWRVGYSAGPKAVIEAAGVVQGHTTSNACSISQKAAIACLKEDRDFACSVIPHLESNRDIAMEILGSIDGLSCSAPRGAFYIFPWIEKFVGKRFGSTVLKSTEEIVYYLLNEKHVAVVPGEGFGVEGAFRVSFAGSESELREGCMRIKQGLEELG